ncbi:hypothetical protein EPA93_42915 [Ktedonosporobacter rubrisoli]|uniref:Uncharacterized protein n=1 Tax=Ktedonosporobacter rubrisoli TaxID=2509675 RepID=A0A4P6K3M1_KTERU|nr:hypothetical protein [Ktedonosporobacter rubrisoli]QBD82370.1 hypothetical protein EPA93_42915 [Ktedonosporobacter rubrisoli]
MNQNEVVDSDEQSLVATSARPEHEVEIPNAPPVRLQTLDLARHIAIAPDGKRYVVATFDDTRMNRGFVTAIFPQQNGYLTLIRLVLGEISHKTPEEALQQHVSLVQLIQQGKLSGFLKSIQ